MRRSWTLLPLALPLLLLLPVALALADDDDEEDEHEHAREAERPRAVIDPTYASECGSCHYAYPPELLPARSWSALLRDLPRHFGDDASVAEPTRTRLETWLVAFAADPRSDAATPLRITETRWWRHEHDELPASWAKAPAIRSFANCPACHTGASRGSFREGELRIPKDAPRP